MVSFDFDRARADAFAAKMEVHANMVRARLEHGPNLSAQEVIDGVRLDHKDFLRLFEMARHSLYDHRARPSPEDSRG